MTAASAARHPALNGLDATPACSRKAPYIAVDITPYAPGVAPNAPLTDPDRCLEFWAATPVQALRETLMRVGRRAEDVEAKPQAMGDTAILARINGVMVPLAFVAALVPPPVVVEALDAIRQGSVR